MRKRTALGFLLLISAPAIYLAIRSQAPSLPEPISPEPQAESESQNELQPEQPLPVPSFPSAPAKAIGGRPLAAPSVRPTLPYAQKPEATFIEFEVVNGVAIAHGDILLGRPEAGFSDKRGRFEAPVPQLWERPEIPYLISPNLPNKARVERALEYFTRNTPIKFVPHQEDRDLIVFEPGDFHCVSSLGRVGGAQPIQLTDGCQTGEIIHEIMHALGFVHEQSRPDRDRFIEVLWDNIEEKFHPQFAMMPDSFMEAIGDSPFDYHSAMLYSAGTFALRPGLFSIRSRGGQPIEPARDTLSSGDIQRLRRLYPSH